MVALSEVQEGLSTSRYSRKIQVEHICKVSPNTVLNTVYSEHNFSTENLGHTYMYNQGVYTLLASNKLSRKLNSQRHLKPLRLEKASSHISKHKQFHPGVSHSS